MAIIKKIRDLAKQMSAQNKSYFDIPDDFTAIEIRGLISELRTINSCVYESCGIYERGRGLCMVWSFK